MFELIELLAAMNAAKQTRIVSVDWMAENHPEILEDALKRAAEKREQAKLESVEAKKQQLMKAIEDAKKAREEKLRNLKGINADIEGMEAELKELQ